MARNFITLLVVCAVMAVAFGQTSQKGTHTSQGGAHTSQGGPNTSQGGPNTSQGGPNTSQEEPHEAQGRVRRQANQNGPLDGVAQSSATWTSCDVTTTPYLSCKDCNTRIICKPVGGLLISCDNPLKPHCNRGICSSVPSADCS